MKDSWSFRIVNGAASTLCLGLLLLSGLTLTARTAQFPGQRDAQEAELHYKVAIAALQDNNLAVARRELEAAGKLAPQNALIYYNLAIVHQKLGAPDAALTSLKEAVRLGLPPEQQATANELLPTLMYEREKTAATFNWLREQRRQARLGDACLQEGKFEETYFEGNGCDLTLVRSSIPDRGRRTSSRYPNVLPRTRSLLRVEVDFTQCGTGVLLMRNRGIEVTLAPQARDSAADKMIIWFEPQLLDEAEAVLRRAAKACGAQIR